MSDQPQENVLDAPVETESEAPTTIDAAEYEAIKAKYERAQQDIQKFKTRQAEVEEAKKAAEEKRLSELEATKQVEEYKAKNAQLEAERDEAKKAAKRAEWKVQLSQHVSDPNAALKLIEDKHVTDEGLNVQALLEDYPILKPGASSVGGGSRQGETKAEQAMYTKQDFAKMTPDQINAYWNKRT